ncbi:MAG: SMC-Scp complex subunit ScpB [Gammaproteobacteria bacterium]|nr:SMC-Scp complex subunit ScpB [Gammaproteobacteria bacterium]
MSDVDNKVKMIVEGLLLAAGRPLTLDNIIQVFSDDEKPDRAELKAVMDSIAQDCNDRGFELMEVASGFRFQVKQDLSEWVAKLWEERPPRYTRALLETLALIAYRQPITRGDIEEIRGVAVSSNIIRTLMDREWVRVVGHRDVPGRPAMFATTKQFLDYFNLKSLQQLPPLSEIKELDKVHREMDLEDELYNSRVLELPEDTIDENSLQPDYDDAEELLAVAEAIELSKKPLDEILNIGMNDDAKLDDSDADVPDLDVANLSDDELADFGSDDAESDDPESDDTGSSTLEFSIEEDEDAAAERD